MNKKFYTLGFLVSTDGTKIALIKKNRPDWQAGYINGIGGKIEDFDLNPLEGMIREFKEETGVLIEKWRLFGEMSADEWVVYCYTAISDEINNIKTKTDEEVLIVDLNDLHSLKIIPNLSWLIPMAMGSRNTYAKIAYNYGTI